MALSNYIKMTPFKNCDECDDNCLSDWMNIIRCDNHSDIENYIKSVCDNCRPEFKNNENWKLDLLKHYKIDITKLKHSDILNYKKYDNYTIIKIHKKNYIKCNDCIKSFIEYNIPTELRKCSICSKENNPIRLAEIECYEDCKKILNVCNYNNKKIMTDNSYLGLSRYEVCFECKSNYLKYK